MAENDQRSYRDPLRWRGAEEEPLAQADDPLAELARLIGQNVPMNKTGRDRPPAPQTAADQRDEVDRAASYDTPDEAPREPSEEPDTAPQDGRYEQNLDLDFRAGHNDRYSRLVRANPVPPPRASRFRQEPDFGIERAREVDDGEANEAAYQEAAGWHDPSSDARDDRYPGYQDEYANEPYDEDDYGYDEQHAEDQHTGRRSGFVFVAAVFALAVLGTAGAFAYRAMFGAPAMPALPPIIKAEGGPNKIIPSDANSQNATRQADASNGGSGERLVSREERPVDVSPPITSTAPRFVSTVPVFPDPPAMGGPGAVVGYTGSPTSSNPAMPTERPVPTAPPMTTATAPNPAPSAAQMPPSTVASTTATATPGTAAAPAPKKIRTVTIHTDQSGVPDASPGAATRPGVQSPPGSNAPLSLVPSATEAAAPPAPARPRAAPAQPVPLSKPPANETASAAPAAPAAAGNGYAVQVSSQRSEAEAQSSFRDLQAKYPNVLGGREPIIRRADLGAKGIYFRAMVGPFTSADQASELCSSLKAAGGSCIVQKN